jgi:hypothetical protein
MSKEYTAFNGDAFWNDGYVQELDMAETAVYFHYITSPRLENSGVFKEGQRMVSFYTKSDIDTVKKADAKLEKDGKIYRIGEWVIVPSSLKHQKFDKSPNAIKGIYEQLKTLPVEVLNKLRQCGYILDLTPVLSAAESEIQPNPSITLSEGLHNPSESLPLYSDSDSDSDQEIKNSSSALAEKDKPETAPEIAEAAPPVVEAPLPDSKPQKPVGKPKKAPLREREPENDYERVEKVYLHNWDGLYKQGKVKTENPVVNWTQTRALLKKHFERLKPDDITSALNRGLNDNFIMQGGYSLAVMLSATVLNRLINAAQGQGRGPPLKPLPTDRKSLGGLDA